MGCRLMLEARTVWVILGKQTRIISRKRRSN
jgi:hypothetical protein